MKSKMKEVLEWQKAALKALAGRMDSFYLAGGTALSLLYFHHRESYDLDFFSQHYSLKEIAGAVNFLETQMRKKARKTVDSNGKKGFARMRRYEIPLGEGEPLKLDFVEDFVEILKPHKRIEGIDYASLDDIYLRKIYAATGIITGKDALGRIKTQGKRQEARDLFDLYHLSTTYKRLTVFVKEFHEKLQIQIPAIIQWYHSLNKIEMSLGLGEIVTTNPVEFFEISRYFKKEIDDLMREAVG
ncbi:MAG: nucleotidyl transferase AbiEii/AbiGii toxin family protein [Candidatus Omnitrophota bacterium]